MGKNGQPVKRSDDMDAGETIGVLYYVQEGVQEEDAEEDKDGVAKESFST
jgi:hypothetical protein